MPLVLGPYPFDVQVLSQTKTFLKRGPEIVSVGMNTIDYAMHVTSATGDALALPGVQFFGGPLVADTPVETTGTYLGTSNASMHATYDASGATSKWALQNGIWVKLDTGGAVGSIQGMLYVAVDGESMPVGHREIEVSPNEDSSHPSLFVLGPYLPRIGATNFRAVIRGTEVADMSWRFYARLANDPQSPQAMEGLGAGFTDFSPSSGNLSINTGNLSVTGLTDFSSYHFIQFILALRMKSGGSNPAGFFKVSGQLAY